MECPSVLYMIYSYPILSLIGLYIVVNGVVRLVRGHPLANED
jgi:hypothetical protein